MNNFEINWEEISDMAGEENVRGGGLYVGKSDMNMEDFIFNIIIIPLCKSVGYTENTINKYIGG